MANTARGISILVLSSGRQADQIGAVLARTMAAQLPGVLVKACPLEGQGAAYRKSGVPVIKTGRGWLGAWWTAWRRGRALRHLRYRFDLVVAIGGFSCLFVADRFLSRPTVFVPTFALGSSAYDAFLIERVRKSCKLVLPQDEGTAERLQAARIPAVYLGRVVVDCIPQNPPGLHLADGRVVGVLPGCGRRAYSRIALLAQLAFQLHLLVPEIVFLVFVASDLKFARIVEALSPHGWAVSSPTPDELADGIVGKMLKSDCVLLFVSGGIGDVIRTAEICLSTDPIASQQAAGLGKPVVALEVEDLGRRKSAVSRQGGREPVIVVRPDVISASKAAASILCDTYLYGKLSLAGKVKMGGQGVASRIVEKVSALLR